MEPKCRGSGSTRMNTQLQCIEERNMLLQKPKPPNFNVLFNAIEFSEPFVTFGQPNISHPMLPQTTPLSQQSSQLCHPNYSLDNVTYTKLVQYSTKTGSLVHGKLAHAHMVKTCFKPCLFLLNNLLNMYCKHGELDSACNLFDKMPKRNVISYNSLISGYTQVGLFDKAMGVFNEARMAGLKLDKFTYAGALCVCGQTCDIELGKLVHGLIVLSGSGSDVVLTNSLMDMYSKCGRVDHARILFENSDNLDDVSWNSLIASYARIGANEETLRTLVKMHQCGFSLNTYTLGSALKACCKFFDNSELFGKLLHGYTVKLGLDLDVVVGTALLDMYAKTGDLGDAIQIFKVMPYRNVVMYNAMIAGFLQIDTFSYEHANEVFNLLSQMQRLGVKPSTFTFSIILRACKSVEAFEYGKQVHTQVCKYDLQGDEFIGSGLIDFYSSLGLFEDALKCFNLTPRLDIVSWTSMVAGYIQNGETESAFDLFYKLLASGKKPDEFIISSMLGACANLAAARSGEQIQGYAVKAGVGKFTIVQNSQICMYAKSGDIDSANLTFTETENPDVVSWSVMICSKAQHGCAREALELFELMKNCGIAPNHITFLGVLTACSHGGLVEEGLRYFENMKNDYGMTTNVEHCACAVDLLGRAGRLVDAENFIFNSGFEDNPVMWRALLSACRVYKDTVAAKRVAEKLINLEPQAAASYVLLYNIYNDAGIELPAKKIRELMTDRGVKKEPGLSWIEFLEMQLVDFLVEKQLTLELSHLCQHWIISLYILLERNFRKHPRYFFVFSTMGKNKIKHELISHEPNRRVTFKKRKASLFRKLTEITTLCGIIACAVVYDPSDSKMDAWPSPQEAFYVLENFKKLPEQRQGRFMMDQKAFLKKNISRLNGQLERARFKNQALDAELLLIEYLEGKNLRDSSRLGSLLALEDQLARKISLITNRIEFMEGLEPNEVDAEIDSDEMGDQG